MGPKSGQKLVVVDKWLSENLGFDCFNVTRTDFATRHIVFPDGLITASHRDKTSILVESDLISYELDKATLSLKRSTAENTDDQSVQTLIGGPSDHMKMKDMAFTYFDQQGKETTIVDDIRSVGISLVAETPAGRKGFLKQSHQTRVKCRNLGL